MDQKAQPILWAEQPIGALVSSFWPFVKIHKISHINSRIGKKWEVHVLLALSSIHSMSSILKTLAFNPGWGEENSEKHQFVW